MMGHASEQQQATKQRLVEIAKSKRQICAIITQKYVENINPKNVLSCDLNASDGGKIESAAHFDHQ